MWLEKADSAGKFWAEAEKSPRDWTLGLAQGLLDSSLTLGTGQQMLGLWCSSECHAEQGWWVWLRKYFFPL